MKRIFEFWSHVAYYGYEIVGARPMSNVGSELPLYIEPMLSMRGGQSISRTYLAEPIAVNDHPSLFMEFAQMEKTPKAVEEFANSYGTLENYDLFSPIRPGRQPFYRESILLPNVQREHLHPIHDIDPMFEPDKDLSRHKGQYVCLAEPLRLWYEEIEQLRQAVGKWRNLKLSDEETKWEIKSLLNTRLSSVSPVLELSARGGSLDLVVCPNDLLSALWLQFAFAIDGCKEYKQCLECRNYFEVGKWGSRGDKKYCRNKCRQAAYDARKRKTA